MGVRSSRAPQQQSSLRAAKPSVPFGGWYRRQEASMWSAVCSAFTVRRGLKSHLCIVERNSSTPVRRRFSLGPYAESSLVACVSHSGTSRSTNSMCWYAENSLHVVDLLVPLSILAYFASAFESSLQHALADFFHINSLTFLNNFTDIKKQQN